MRKAASHWKAQHGKLKEQLDAALAAAPADTTETSTNTAETSTSTAETSTTTAELEAAKASLEAELLVVRARVAALEIESQAALEAKAAAVSEAREAAAAEAREAAVSETRVATEAAAASAAEAEEFRGKLAAAEEAGEKMRKAASHWKAQHGKLKEQLDAAAAAPATASTVAPVLQEGDTAAVETELKAAKARVLELETAKAVVEGELDKYRKAAHFWKQKHDALRAPKSEVKSEDAGT
jgi:hypothetical protein